MDLRRRRRVWRDQEEYDRATPAAGYTREQQAAVEAHIQRSYGAFTKRRCEPLAPGCPLELCQIPPEGEKGHYTLVTLGMGAWKMQVPPALAEHKLDRAELVIALPAGWQVKDGDERWYWPLRLLQALARLPARSGSWLGWGYMVDNRAPFAAGTGLSGVLLVGPQGAEEGAEVCSLPGGEEEVNFYQVIPLYRSEMEYKAAHGARKLLERLTRVSFVVDPNRPDALEGAQFEGADVRDLVMDDAAWHLRSIREKGLPVEELAAFNHLAIYLRWCAEHDLLAEGFLAHARPMVDRLLADPETTDLRPWIRDELHGLLLRPCFNEQGAAFAVYYYGQGDAPHYPSDVDDHALEYFGPARYASEEFRDEAYLFVPFDEAYYQAMARVIDRRWEGWRRNAAHPTEAEEPGPVARALLDGLGVECRYFAPMADNDPILAAYGYARRLGLREGYTPVLVAVDETLRDCLVSPTDPPEAAERPAPDPRQAARFRETALAEPLPAGKALLAARLAGQPVETEMEAGPLEGGEAFDRLLGCWDHGARRTLPLVMARIPVREPWKVFAWLPFIGGGPLPEVRELLAVARYWQEEYGATPVLVSRDTVEFSLPAPAPEQRALELAREQWAFCPGLVGRNGEQPTLGALADTLRCSRLWYFRWD